MNENRISKIGRVMSDRMDKTVVVRVETLKQHPLYKKTIRYRVKFNVNASDRASGGRAGIYRQSDEYWKLGGILRHSCRGADHNRRSY